MKINGLGIPGMGGASQSGAVDKIMEAESAPLDSLKQKRVKTLETKNEYKSFQGMIDGLGKSLDGLRSADKFEKLKLESSHPELLDGVLSAGAKIGSYELELEGLAKMDRHVAFGFEDIDKTPVGFGYMGIDRGDQGGVFELQIDPGATLKDVASQINSAKAGVRAEIVNTGITDEPFRLLVSSEKTGEDFRISLDPDTTFLEFKNNVVGSNLKAKFEDVNVERSTNKLDNLVEGLTLNAKQAAPGTKIQINVAHDVDKTFDGIKDFTEQFNKISEFSRAQSAKDPSTGLVEGKLPGDSSVRQVVRSLQTQMASTPVGDGKFRSLADIGITTNAKTGALEINEQKVKEALSQDYESVAKIFTRSEDGVGIAEKLSQAVKNIQNSESGPIKSRMRGLDKMIRQQDQNIAQQTERLDKRREQVQRQFNNLDAKLAQMGQQQSFLDARFGNQQSSFGSNSNNGKAS